MPKETVFKKYTSDQTDLVGWIIIHPRLGSGLITDYRNPSTLDSAGVYTVLWSDGRNVEDVSGQVVRESRIISGDETF